MRNIVLMETVSANKKKYQKKYKCPYCDKKFERSKLHIHIQNDHEEMIPEGYTALRVAFNTINHKERGSCIICGNESRWNEDKGRYERLCDNPKCKEAYKQMAAQRNRKKYGTDRLQTDPRYSEEVQRKALAGRRISGEYVFKDGGKVQYVGSYERKCLEFLDLVMHCNSIDVQGPGPAIKYTVKDKEHLYLPDFYYVPYNLIIEIKDGGDNPNNNPDVKRYKAIHQAAKEKAVADTKKYNYVRVVNNDFSQLMSAMAVIKYQLDDESIDPVIMINESSGIMTENNILVKLHAPDKLYRLDAYDKDGEYISPNDIITNGPKAIRFYNSIEEALADMDIRHFAHDMYVHTTVDDPADFLWYKPKSSNNSGVWVTTDIKVKCIGKIRPYTDGEDLDNLNRFYRWIYRNDNNEDDIKRFTESASINTESNFNLDYFDKSIQEGYDLLNESSSSFINSFLKENNINDAKDLYNWMHKNIKYKSDGIYHSPEEVITSKSGDCHDQAELEKVCLSKLGYIAVKLFMVEYYDYSKPGGATHTLTIFAKNKPFDTNYKWYWFENAWESKSGIHKLEDSLSPEKMYAPIFKSWRWSGKCDKLYWTQVRANLKYGCDLGEYVGKLTPEKEPKKHIYYKDQSLNESYIRDEEDILYNKDKFDSGEINLCYIIGLSGSGKSTLAKDLSSSSKNIQSIELDNLISTWRFSDKRLEQLGGLIYSFFEKYPKYRIPYRATGDEIIEFIRQNFKDESDYFDSIIDDFIAYSASYARSHTRERFIINGVEILHIEPSRLKDNAVYIKGTSALKSWYRSLIRDFKEAPDNRERIDWTVSKFKAIPNYVNFEKVVQQWRDYYSNIAEKSVNESYVINEKDILYNKGKFDSGEINLCFITGHSGSGKSTMARDIQKNNVEHYELDDLECIKDHFTMAQLKEYGDLIYSYFNGPGKKFYITFKELEEKQIPGSEYEDKLFPGFVKYAMQYAKSHKDRKYVIEGVWLFCDGDNGSPWFNPIDFDDYAFYIKGTSMLISKIRAAIRDSKDAETGPAVYSKLNRFAAFSANFIKRNWKFYIMDEKNIKRFRDHFSRLVDRDKIVKESAGDIRLSLRHFKKIPIDENVVKQYKLTHLRYGDNYNGYIFIDKDGELACFVQTEDKSSKIWIQALEVSKKYRSQGLGKQLLDFTCKTLKARYLSVKKTNTVAIKMYEKYGFVTYKETDYMYFMKLNRK